MPPANEKIGIFTVYFVQFLPVVVSSGRSCSSKPYTSRQNRKGRGQVPHPRKARPASNDGKAQGGAGDHEKLSPRLSVAADRNTGHQAAAASATGNVSSNAVPFSDSTTDRAAMGISMARTMASPIPVPPLSRLVVKKLSI